MRIIGIWLAVSLAASAAHAAPPGLTMSFESEPEVRAAPLSVEDADLLETGEIGAGKWTLGVGVATGVGFGLGQTVQGRWRDTGWIFTVGEAASLTMLMLTLPALTSENCYDCASYHHTDRDRAARIAIGSLIAWAGFRTWGVADALFGPAFHNRRYHAAAARHPELTQMAVVPFVVPSDRGNGGIAGLSFGF